MPIKRTYQKDIYMCRVCQKDYESHFQADMCEKSHIQEDIPKMNLCQIAEYYKNHRTKYEPMIFRTEDGSTAAICNDGFDAEITLITKKGNTLQVPFGWFIDNTFQLMLKPKKQKEG